MTTISAGAAAGLLVVLMVMSTNDGFGAELQPASDQARGFLNPGTIRGFNPQPDPPREAPQPEAPAVPGDGSVKPAGH